MNLKNLLGLLAIALLILVTSCQDDIMLEESSQSAFESVEQQSRRVCLSNEHTQHLLQDPAYKKLHDNSISAFRKFDAQPRLKMACASPVLVPVAIHYQGVNNPDANCLQQLAIDQMNRINLDYAGENSDISTWTQAASTFGGVSNGEMCVKFVIADQNHPSGYGLNNGDLAITINRTQGDQVSNWAGYINIFVQFNTGALGYSPLGGVGNGDGVVIDAVGWGAGSGCGSVAPEAPYNLGRTLTHELGHYLLLDHIWGDGCGVDDEVADTPDQASDNNGCPNIGISSCGSADLHMNYMDYTNDACMYMFSAGQVSRMSNYLQASLGSITNNASNVYSGGGNGGGNGGGGTCDQPSGLTANVGGETSAQLSWSSAANANDYQVRYRATGTSNYQTVSSTTTSVTLQNLNSSTSYEASVRTRCASQNSAYTSNISFTTEDDGGNGGGNGGGNDLCITPQSSTVSVENASKVFIDWEDVPDAIRYQVRYRVVGGSWTKKGAANSQKTLNNLTPEAHEYQLRTRCGNSWTAWSAKQTFDLTPSGGGNGDGSFKIVVTLDEFGSETSWELYDEYNDRLKKGGPYNDGEAGTQKTKTVDLADGCYEIDLYDSYGDGICCEYGNGQFEILDSDNNRVAFSDGNFGSYELIQFCVESGRARIIHQERDAKKLSRGKKKG